MDLYFDADNAVDIFKITPRVKTMPISARLAFLVVLASFCILAGALWTQHQGYAPCPLCILQRIAYLGILLLALTAAMLWLSGFSMLPNATAMTAVLACLAGFGVAAKHVWLIWHPGQTCGLDPLATTINLWPITQWLPWMFRADGFCSDTPYLLGQSLPLWSALGFFVLGSLLCAAIFANLRRHGGIDS